MSLTLDESGTGCGIRLEGDIDITVSADLKAMVIKAIASRKELRVNLAAATDLDITAVQVLWSAAREFEKTKAPFSLDHVPESVRCAVREMGFENLIEPVSPAAVLTDSMGSASKSAHDR